MSTQGFAEASPPNPVATQCQRSLVNASAFEAAQFRCCGACQRSLVNARMLGPGPTGRGQATGAATGRSRAEPDGAELSRTELAAAEAGRPDPSGAGRSRPKPAEAGAWPGMAGRLARADRNLPAEAGAGQMPARAGGAATGGRLLELGLRPGAKVAPIIPPQCGDTISPQQSPATPTLGQASDHPGPRPMLRGLHQRTLTC